MKFISNPGKVVQSPYRTRRAKGSIFQGGINVPMVISGKKTSSIHFYGIQARPYSPGRHGIAEAYFNDEDTKTNNYGLRFFASQAKGRRIGR